MYQIPLRVFLVENSLPIRARVRSSIEESVRAEIVGEASTIAEALPLFAAQLPDAVILDLYLPDGNAFGLITEFKRSHPACVVVVLTAFSTPETEAHCRLLGANHFFEKTQEFEQIPVVLTELQESRTR